MHSLAQAGPRGTSNMDHWHSTLVVFLASLHVCHGLLQMPRWFGDNLVLQTNSQYGSRSFLNGKADPGECDSNRQSIPKL